MRCFLKLKKSGLKPKNDALKTKGNAKKVTLKIHSLAKFTALKYLRRTQNVTRRPGRATAHSVCFLLLLLQSAVHAGGLPRVSARFAHLALG